MLLQSLSTYDYKVSEDIILNPDLCIACKPIREGYLNFSPELVVEILSPATVLKDRHTNLKFIKRKIPYYIIVDVEKKAIEVYHLTEAVYQKEVDQQHSFPFSFSDCRIEIIFDNIWS